MITKISDYIINILSNENVYSTILLLFMVIAIRFVLQQMIMIKKWKNTELRLKWLSIIRSIIFLIIIIGLITIWARELRSIAVSIVAFFFALVVASKELILCISGSIFRFTSQSFNIGDRIEINGNRGDVIKMNLLSTTILEIGPGINSQQITGRAIIIPNSDFLSNHIVNENFGNDFILHIFQIPFERKSNWKEAENLLYKISKDICDEYIDAAKKSMLKLKKREGIEPPNVEPRVQKRIDSTEMITFLVRIAVPFRSKNLIEQKIIDQFLTHYSL